jgi:hypothetical protein
VFVGVAGWRRLASLRAGTVDGPWPAARRRSSSATWLAAVAGGAASSVAAAGSDWPGWLRAPLAAWAALVVVAGVTGRVTAVLAADDGVVVRRAVLGDRAVGRNEVRRVVPPRWPLGAWRIDGDTGHVTLMPSDLRGAEAALPALILQAGLRFRDGEWRRPG